MQANTDPRGFGGSSQAVSLTAAVHAAWSAPSLGPFSATARSRGTAPGAPNAGPASVIQCIADEAAAPSAIEAEPRGRQVRCSILWEDDPLRMAAGA